MLLGQLADICHVHKSRCHLIRHCFPKPSHLFLATSSPRSQNRIPKTTLNTSALATYSSYCLDFWLVPVSETKGEPLFTAEQFSLRDITNYWHVLSSRGFPCTCGSVYIDMATLVGGSSSGFMSFPSNGDPPKFSSCFCHVINQETWHSHPWLGCRAGFVVAGWTLPTCMTWCECHVLINNHSPTGPGSKQNQAERDGQRHWHPVVFN